MNVAADVTKLLRSFVHRKSVAAGVVRRITA
jgi:hypothetical protein